MASNSRDETIKYTFKAEGGESIDAVEKSIEGVIDKSLGTETAFSFIKQHLEEITVAAIALEAALKTIEFGKQSVSGAEDVEAILSRVKALAGQAAGAFGDMDAAIEKAAQTVNVSSADSATALAKLVENGLNAKDAIAALIPTLQLAKIANVDVGTAANDVARALAAFSLPATDAQQVVDQLTAASHGAAGGLGEMSSAAVTLAPDAKTLGLSFTDVVSVLGLLNSKGLETTNSVRGLRTVFQDLQNPTSTLRGELLGLGDGSSSFTAAIAALTSGTPQANQALQTLTGPARSLIELLGQAGPDAIQQFNAKLQDTQGIADKTAKLLDDNLGGASKRFGLAIENIGEQLAKPVLEPFAQELNKLAGELNEFAASPDFAEIKTEIGDIVKDGVLKLDEAIHNLDWKGFLNDGKSALKELGDNFNTVADSAVKTAAAVGQLGDFIGVAYHTLGTTVAVGAGIAATAVEDLTGKTELLDDLVSRAGDSASQHFEKLSQDALALGGASDTAAASSTKAADSVKAHGDAAAAAAPKIEQGAAATDKYSDAQERFAQAERDATVELPAMVAKLGQGQHAVEGFSFSLAAAAQKQIEFQKAKDGTIDAVGTLATAFNQLKISSQAALELSAKKAAEYFETVDKLSANTAAGLIDRQNAFLAYAKTSLAASAQLDDGTRASAQAELEQRAAVLGVSDALDDLEKKSASSQAALVSDANRGAAALTKELDAADSLAGKLHGGGGAGDGSVSGALTGLTESTAESQRQFTEWGTESGKSAQELGADISHANDGMAALSQGIGDARAQFLSVSDAAAKFYDTVLKGNFDIGHSDDGSGFDRVARAMQAALQATEDEIAANRTQLQGMVDAANNVGTESVEDFNKLGGAAKYTESQLATMIASIQAGVYGVGLLGQQDLAPLQAALEAAKQRVDALKTASEAAQQQLADMGAQLQDDLDNASGNQEGVEDRRYKKQLADLQAAAQTAGQLNSAQYQIDVANANALHALKMQQIEQQAKAQQQADKQSAPGGSPVPSGSSAAGSGAQPGSVSNAPANVLASLHPVTLDFGSAMLQLYGTPAQISDASDLLRQLAAGRNNSILGG